MLKSLASSSRVACLDMTLNMNDDSMVSIAQVKEFLKFESGARFSKTNRGEAYEWIGRTLGKFRYFGETKKNRGIIKKYLGMYSGYSNAQIDRLIACKRITGRVCLKERTQPTFPRVYTSEDIALIAEVDNAESRRTGGAVKKTFADMYHVYEDARFKRLANISVSHLYNLRGTRIYQSRSLTYTKTNPVQRDIGIRKKPQPFGKPGYLRVDSVHQGDRDKEKGVYHINLVDEITQDEVVITVYGISEEFLRPALEEALDVFPFILLGFHSDNGSEYINEVVAKLLQKLFIEQTKSRSRHSNDNALAEGKNAAVVRKHFGYAHIPRKYASLMQEFNRKYLNPYLFFHRQCAFADDSIDEKGKIKKVYKTYLTPCEKLLSIPNVKQYLKPGTTKESLRTQMVWQTHLAAAQEMQTEKEKLFAKIHSLMLR
jgi:transposase InsO family protein